ncbi:MAG TPA: aminotransferase class III-fold pyridoxal phosphate-dependent enzyme, partial [Pseudonocardia sp.]|nr:aminotransferase class III-fold pyridoxal phosphate-dependent enzyme [Pseudonocardia sp.]
TLIKPELDVWGPGEHNGTFRGHNPAFVTASAALRKYWADDQLERSTLAKGEHVDAALRELAGTLPGDLEVKGRGLARGLGFAQTEVADQVAAACFEHGLLLETAGPSSEVAKLMPALTITDAELDEGLEIFADAVRGVVLGGSS